MIRTWGVGVWVVFALPPFALALWAALYLADWVEYWGQPISNVEFSYEGQRGLVRGRASEVRLDFLGGGIKARDVELSQSETGRIARVGFAHVVIPLPWNAVPAYYATVSDGDVHIVRYPDGTWNFQDVAPKPTGEPPQPYAFEIVGERIRARFRDSFVKPERLWTGSLSGLHAAGTERGVFARSRFDVSDLGTGGIELWVEESYLQNLTLRDADVEISPLRAYALSLPESSRQDWLTQWSLRSGNFRGDFDVSLKEEVSFHGRGTVRAEGFRYIEYPAVSGVFAGSFSDDGAVGELRASSDGSRIDGRLALSGFLRNEVTGWYDGYLFAAHERAVRPWVGSSLPSNIRFASANYRGKVSFGEVVKLDGRIEATRARYDSYDAQRLTANFVGGSDTLRIENARADVFNTTATGRGAITFGNTPSIAAEILAQRLDMTTIPQLPEEYVKGGVFDLRVLLHGPLRNVTATVRADGEALVAVRDRDASRLETFAFAMTGTTQGEVLRIESAEAAGRSGRLRGKGTVALDGSRIDITAVADSLDLASVPMADLRGTAFADFRVFGTSQRPRLDGYLEAYGAAIGEYEVPFVSAHAFVDGKNLALRELTGRSGVTALKGDVNVILEAAGALSGSGEVEDLALSELTEEKVQGLAKGTWVLSGSLESPTLHGTVVAEEAVADQLEIRNLRGTGNWRPGEIDLLSASAEIGGGTLSASGMWRMNGASAIQLQMNDIGATAFRSYLDGEISLSGLLSGSGEIRFLDGAFHGGIAEASLRQFAIGSEPVGSGFLEATFTNSKVDATGAIGTTENYFAIDSATYDWQAGIFSAEASTLRASISDTVAIVQSALKHRASPSLFSELSLLSGTYSASAAMTFTRQEQWEFDTGSFELSTEGLRYDDNAFGDVNASVVRSGGRHEIQGFQLSGGPASVRLVGDRNFVDDEGNLHIDGEVANLDLSWLEKIDVRFAGLRGYIDGVIVVDGNKENPHAIVTANGREVSYGEYAADNFTVGPLTLSDRNLRGPDGGPAARVSVRGLEAQVVDVQLPLESTFAISGDRPLYVRVVVPSRDIRELSKFFGGLDVERTSGRIVGGELVVSGLLSELKGAGAFALEAEKIKFADFDTAFQNASLGIGFSWPNVQVHADATSEFGGSLRLRGGLDLTERLVLDGTELRITDFGVLYKLGPDSSAKGRVNAELFASGDALEPLITGSVRADEALLSLTGEYFSNPPSKTMTFNPFFDVDLSATGGKVTSSLLTALANGHGTLRGPLQQPSLDMDFAIESGEIALPTGRIRIEKDGKASLRYGTDFRGETSARLDIDITATTRVTADGGFGPQRYLVTLHITGDLLGEQELNIDAESDPADLSKTQILSILGQQKLFEDVVALGTSGDFNSQLKGLLTSVLAPAVLGQFTRSLESTFGLEYIALDFSQGGFGGITLAKALGSGWTLEYRRTLEQFALTGEPLEEIRLTYRPISSNPLLGRLRFSVSADRTGLLRVTLGYSKRF